MAAEGRELGWEDSIKQDAQDYEPSLRGKKRPRGEKKMLKRTVSVS